MMSLSKRAALLSSAVLLTGCDAGPPPGAPRAPLPSKITAPATPPASSEFKPRSLQEARKEFEAKKAKKAADDAAKAAADGPNTALDAAKTPADAPKTAPDVAPPKPKAATP